MNIILLTIWVKILLITLLCVYYHFKILNKFLISNTPSQPQGSPLCQYSGIPTTTLKDIEKTPCRTINGDTTYNYNLEGVSYEIAKTQQSYAKVCTGFCIGGISSTGDCKIASEQQKFLDCETLLKPKQGCVSSAKPLVNITDIGPPQPYYAVSPINSINSCS